MFKFISAFVVALLISASVYADGSSNWEALEKLAHNRESLTIVTEKSKTTYAKGEKLILHITIDKPSYLNVVSIDANDKVIVLFPNKYHPENLVFAGGFTLPTRKMKFDLTTQAPFGKTLVTAFLTPHKVNLYQLPTKSITPNSDLNKQIFKQLSDEEVVSFSKAFEPTEKQNKPTESKPETKFKSKVGKLELMTCETTESC